MNRPRITVFDTTLRDGEQSPGCSMNVQEKVRLAQQLDRLGVDVIEAGFPIASDGDFEAVQRIAASIRRPVIAGLARACKPDIDRAWQALQGAAHPRIHVFLASPGDVGEEKAFTRHYLKSVQPKSSFLPRPGGSTSSVGTIRPPLGSILSIITDQGIYNAHV